MNLHALGLLPGCLSAARHEHFQGLIKGMRLTRDVRLEKMASLIYVKTPNRVRGWLLLLNTHVTRPCTGHLRLQEARVTRPCTGRPRPQEAAQDSAATWELADRRWPCVPSGPPHLPSSVLEVSEALTRLSPLTTRHCFQVEGGERSLLPGTARAGVPSRGTRGPAGPKSTPSLVSETRLPSHDLRASGP